MISAGGDFAAVSEGDAAEDVAGKLGASTVDGDAEESLSSVFGATDEAAWLDFFSAKFWRCWKMRARMLSDSEACAVTMDAPLPS